MLRVPEKVGHTDGIRSIIKDWITVWVIISGMSGLPFWLSTGEPLPQSNRLPVRKCFPICLRLEMAPRDGQSKHSWIDSRQKQFQTADAIPVESRGTDLYCR